MFWKIENRGQIKNEETTWAYSTMLPSPQFQLVKYHSIVHVNESKL